MGAKSSVYKHPIHWRFPPRSSPSGYISLAHKPPCTSKGPHNMNFEPRITLQEHISKGTKKYKCGLSPTGRAKPKKYLKTNLRLSFQKTHLPFSIAKGTPNTTCSKKGRSLPMVGKMRSSIFGSPMMAPNSSIVGHSSIPLKQKTCRVGPNNW